MNTGLAWYENIPRWSLISLSVYKRYYVFLVVHGFLVVTLSSGLTASIPKVSPRSQEMKQSIAGNAHVLCSTLLQILSNPGSVIEDLSTRLPDASTFFLTYTVRQIFLFLATLHSILGENNTRSQLASLVQHPPFCSLPVWSYTLYTVGYSVTPRDRLTRRPGSCLL